MATKKDPTDFPALLSAAAEARKQTLEWAEGLESARREEAKVTERLRDAAGPEGLAVLADLLGLVHNQKKQRPRRAGRDYRRKDRIVALITERGGLVSLEEVRDVEQCSMGAASSAMRALQKEGIIVRRARGRYALKGTGGPANGTTT